MEDSVKDGKWVETMLSLAVSPASACDADLMQCWADLGDMVLSTHAERIGAASD